MPTIFDRVGNSDGGELADTATDAVEEQFQSRTDAPGELTDIRGVGEGTAEKLREADIDRPEDLRGVSTESLARIDGIGPTRAEQIRTTVDYPDFGGDVPGEGAAFTSTIRNPFEDSTTVDRRNPEVDAKELSEQTEEKQEGAGTRSIFAGRGGRVDRSPRNISIRGPDKREAVRAQADRSAESRQADRSFNAPITLDVDVWKQNKDELDYPGVDTVPRSRRLDRTETALKAAFDRGEVSTVRATDEDSDRFGFHRRSDNLVAVDTGVATDPEATLAHEVGHAVDAGLSDDGEGYFAEQEGLFDDPQVEAQAETLAERRRSRPAEDVRESYSDDYDYDFDRELFADVFAEIVEEPRAARREAPDAVEAVEAELAGSGFLPGKRR